MLTPRENLLSVFRHERPAWVPVGGHADPYNQPNRRGMDPRLAQLLGEVRWHDDGRAYLISEVTRTGRDEVILVIQRVAAA